MHVLGDDACRSLGGEVKIVLILILTPLGNKDRAILWDYHGSGVKTIESHLFGIHGPSSWLSPSISDEAFSGCSCGPTCCPKLRSYRPLGFLETVGASSAGVVEPKYAVKVKVPEDLRHLKSKVQYGCGSKPHLTNHGRFTSPTDESVQNKHGSTRVWGFYPYAICSYMFMSCTFRTLRS